jgi:pimeloyl-ACP methyl ester carboxylesterase
MAGRYVKPPYTLQDMAEDTIGLMDALGIDKASICGISMGGMIAQIMAMNYPERLTGLTSLQSSTGELDLPQMTPAAMDAMMSVPPMDREGYIEHMVGIFRVFAGGSKAFDEDLQRDICARAFDRSFYPMGFLRQMSALVTAAGRRNALGRVTAPTLVMHGDCDPVVPLAHGRDSAAAITGAKLLIIQGLGHGMAFPDLWRDMVDAIAAL